MVTMSKYISFRKEYFVSFAGHPPPPAVAINARNHASSQPPQVLEQQSTVASRSQINQSLPPKSVQQQVAVPEPILQQKSAPKIIPQLEQQRQPAATAVPMRGVNQPVVVPPNITPSVPVNINSTVVSNAAVVAQGPHNPENPQR